MDENLANNLETMGELDCNGKSPFMMTVQSMAKMWGW